MVMNPIFVAVVNGSYIVHLLVESIIKELSWRNKVSEVLVEGALVNGDWTHYHLQKETCSLQQTYSSFLLSPQFITIYLFILGVHIKTQNQIAAFLGEGTHFSLLSLLSVSKGTCYGEVVGVGVGVK